jgi:hypothetical protein
MLNKRLNKNLFQEVLSGGMGPVAQDPEGLARKLLAEGGRSAEDIKRINIDTGMHPAGPHWRPKWMDRMQGGKGQEHIQLPKRMATPMIVSHEVGHASATNPLSKALRMMRGQHYTAAVPYGLLLGGTLAGDTDATEMNLAQKAALPAAIAHAALHQGEEMRASFVGRNLMKRTGQQIPHFWKQLLKTQGTYGLANLGFLAPIAGGTYALHKVMQRRREAQGLKKTSSEIANNVLHRMGVQ